MTSYYPGDLTPITGNPDDIFLCDPVAEAKSEYLQSEAKRRKEIIKTICVSFRKKEKAGEQSSNCTIKPSGRKTPRNRKTTKKSGIQPAKSYLRSPKLYKIFILFSLLYTFGMLYKSVPRNNAINCTMSLCICAAV